MSAIFRSNNSGFLFNKHYLDGELQKTVDATIGEIRDEISKGLTQGLYFSQIARNVIIPGLPAMIRADGEKIKRVYVRLHQLTNDKLKNEKPPTLFQILRQIEEVAALRGLGSGLFFGTFIYTAAMRTIQTFDKTLPGVTDQAHLWTK
jgi:hypothetical protein